MWTVAIVEFLLLKFATLQGIGRGVPPWKVGAYLGLWPGMSARRFLHPSPAAEKRPRLRELLFAIAKLVLGIVLMAWAIVHAFDETMLRVGWVGMLGLIFTLHFGWLHVVSWFWRWVGIDAPPIMRAPIAATSLAEFWSERWNIAFADGARRFVFRPLARHCGARAASAIVFLVSGLIHETVVSLPARGGWGGPTLYFLVQAGGVAVEKSRYGVRAGLDQGLRGWSWMVLFTALPLPLLFHEPFVRHVLVPFYRTLSAFIS
jgi:alginate O-acetyltransferase complex protein AlgI